MDDSKTGMSWVGVLFVILVIWAIFGGGFGNGWGGNRSYDNGGCGRVSNCEVEKREIIDSARTQYLTEQQSEETRLAIRDSRDAVMGQASRIYEAQQSETIFDLKMENQSLKSQIYNDAKFTALSQQISECCCGFNRRLDGIEDRMLTRPNLYGVASTCAGQVIPAVFGNGRGSNWNRGCDCNN